MTYANDEHNTLRNYKSDVKIIAFSIAFVVIFLTIVFFIKTYLDIKQRVFHSMYVEAHRLEKSFSEDLNYVSYILNVLAEQFKDHHNDYNYIYDKLQAYSNNSNRYSIFGWTDFTWTDADRVIRVSKQLGILKKLPEYYDYIAEIQLGKVHFGPMIIDNNCQVIPISIGLADNSGKHVGNISVNFDITTLIHRLNERKKNDYTNFVIIDKRLRVVVTSQMIIPNIGIRKNLVVSNNLIDMLKKINFFAKTTEVFSYLDMVSGLNYYAKKIDQYPFILLINMGDDEINKNIFSKVLVKFLEISIFSLFFVCLIISIYKRETWLRTQAEKASQVAIKATQSKTDFLAYTAHEIRSPLGFILTGSEIMQKELFGVIGSKYKDYVNGINQSANLILDFINDILDESHIAEGHFKIENSINELAIIIDKACKTNKTRFNDRKIAIQTEIANNLPQLICDGRRMLQAINNIVSNAIKYSKDYTTITISAKIIEDKLHILITDQGIGMSEQDLKIALTKYGTVRKKNFSCVQSYGLGLPIVKKLIEAHGAELLINSKINYGTEVNIVFPKHKLIYAISN